MPYLCEESEVEFEAVEHVILISHAKHTDKTLREVVEGETYKRKEFLVELVVARLANGTHDSLAFLVACLISRLDPCTFKCIECLAVLHGLDTGLDDALRCREVGLAKAEADDIVHAIGLADNGSDRGSGYGGTSLC